MRNFAPSLVAEYASNLDTRTQLRNVCRVLVSPGCTGESIGNTEQHLVLQPWLPPQL
jgi:hypothetical protein